MKRGAARTRQQGNSNNCSLIPRRGDREKVSAETIVMGKRGCRFLLIALAGSCAPSFAALAQSQPAEEMRSRPADGVRASADASYPAADFSRFSPRTALDMLQQVPGFTIQREAESRGLGDATGNVVVNGRRISGKSNDVVTELRKISAANVVRIEIADASSIGATGLSGRVANIIVGSEGFRTQFEWRPEFRARDTSPVLLNGGVSASGALGPVAYVLGLRNDATRNRAAGITEILDASGLLIEERRERVLPTVDRARASGSFTYEAPAGAVANLNLSYGRSWFRNTELSDRSGPGQPDSLRQLTRNENEHSYELGGDYQFALLGGQLKLIALHQLEHSPILSVATTSFADLQPDRGERFDRISDEKETIARAEYGWQAGGADWRLSAEGAINSLDNVGRLFTLRPDGDFEEVPLAGGTATIAEDRFELMAGYARSLGRRLAVQLSAGGEYSQLRQSGPLGLTRTFYRPKGSLSAAWKVSPELDVNARVERKVGQLSFFDLLASVNLVDDRVNGANPDLVPPQSWEAEATAVRDLGEWGQATFKVYGRAISDIIDQIPIGETGEGLGNAGKATAYGIETRSTINLDPIGWHGAKLDARVQLQKSSMRDPLTGEPRRVSGDLARLFDFALRHDVADTQWAWGGAILHSKAARRVRLSEHFRAYEGPVLASLFIENKDVLGLKVRGSLSNLLGADQIMDRVAFSRRRDGPVAFRELRHRTVGPTFSLSMAGAF